jgi:preprotein translocase subunit SecG
MEHLVTIIHVLAAAGVIGLVLLQHGKGADMGAAFGSGASGSLFGVSGSSNFMSKATAACVAVFFATSLTLAYMSSHRAGNGSVIKNAVKAEAATQAIKTEAVKPAETIPAESTPKDSAAKDIPN